MVCGRLCVSNSVREEWENDGRCGFPPIPDFIDDLNLFGQQDERRGRVYSYRRISRLRVVQRAGCWRFSRRGKWWCMKPYTPACECVCEFPQALVCTLSQTRPHTHTHCYNRHVPTYPPHTNKGTLLHSGFSCYRCPATSFREASGAANTT